MNKYNLWKWDRTRFGPTGGWLYMGMLKAVSEDHALYLASIQLQISPTYLRVYLHADSAPEVVGG